LLDMELIGRSDEKYELERILTSTKSEFAVVYGRRRIGKTFLIRKYFEEKFSLHFTGMNGVTKHEQIDNFYNEYFKHYKLPRGQKKAINWMGAFQHLIYSLERNNRAKKVIFIDELPWIATPQSKFIAALDHFWNHWASLRSDVVLIVCGSAATWMINNILKNKGGLHNRVTRRIKLNPFTLHETELFLKHKKFKMSRYEIVKLYMSLGGIPFYLDLLDNKYSVSQNIDRLCFSKNGALRNEFNELYASLFKKPQLHIKIVQSLGTKSKGMNRLELLKHAKLANAGSTTRILEELEESGFITKYHQFGKISRDSIYQLTDFFTLFHFKFIQKSNPLDKNIWLNKLDHPSQRAWSGYTYEMVCLQHIEQIKKALGISGIMSYSSTWQSKEAQIDLLIDRQDNVVNLCEMKFSTEKFMIDKRYFEVLQNKVACIRKELKKTKSIHLVMMTTYGLEASKYNDSIVAHSLNMEILFD
jgi:uncharacterized protein